MSQAKKKKPIAADGKSKKKIGPMPAGKAETALNVLLLEDNPADAELIERQLRKAGLRLAAQRVDARSGFLRALKALPPDLILADFSLAGFNALQALDIRNRTAPFIPFIIISGSISEEIAVACMKQGADDYLLKDRLARLPEAIRHVLATRRLLCEKAEAEATLRNSLTQWRTTFDAMNDAVCLLDGNGCILRCNRAMNRLLGLSFDKIIGKDCLDLICGAGKKPLCAFRLLKKSRRRQEEDTFWRGRWYHVAVDPIADSGGKTIGAVHIMSDVTDAREAAKKLAASEKQFRDLYENATIGLYRTTPDGRILMANQALVHMLGFVPFTELAGRNLEKDGFEPGYPRTYFQELLKKSGQVSGLESAWKRQDGTTIFVRESAMPIRGEDGAIRFYDGTVEDISERKRAEMALRENEAFLDRIIEQSPMAMWISDAQGTLLRINPACCNLLHLTPDEVAGKYNLLRDNIVKAQGLLPLVRRVFEKGEAVRFEITYDTTQLKNLELARSAALILDVTIFPIKNLQGRVTHAVIQDLDITQRRHAEESLREMNEIFRLFLKHSPIYVFIKDEDIRPVYLSANYEKLLGKPMGEILGKSMDELFPSELSRTMVEDDKRILSEGKPNEFIEELGGRIYSTIKFPIFIQGKAKYLAGYTTDITERRQSEERLRVTSKRLELALAVAKAGIWDWNVATGVIEWSPQMFELFGLDPRSNKASFASWRTALHPDDRELAENRIELAMKQRSTLDSDYRVILPDGGVRWINAQGEGVYDEEGRPVQMIGICQDISDRKRTEEKIRASLQKKKCCSRRSTTG